jgi:hypothetical protein
VAASAFQERLTEARAFEEGAMLKAIRIGDGRVVAPDRSMRTTKNSNLGGPDRVKWIHVGPNQQACTVEFVNSPFAPGAQSISVPLPGSAEYEVTQPAGVYKYSVVGPLGIDDPDVIIE